jgi:TPP-dependent pyruvate/acetoin dehydrogenase alpha subunit
MSTAQTMPTAQMLHMYEQMVLIRRYEEYLYRLFLQGKVPGTLHQCQGQEAVAVGVCAALRKDDVIFSTHRPVGHLLAKGASINEISAEIWGKASGCAGGKGGQMHLVDVSVGAYPSNAIVGANIPIAVGAAIGFRLRGLDRVAVSFFGDGASNIGAFHEGINLAAVKNAPVIFVCENNLYAASTHLSETMLIDDIADRAASYGIPGIVVDGMDVMAVFEAAERAVQRARRDEGPTLLECKTYRYRGHSRGDPCGYRSAEELQAWQQRDPLISCRAWLAREAGVTNSELEELENAADAMIEAAVEFAVQSPDPPVRDVRGPIYAEGQYRKNDREDEVHRYG